MRSLDIAGTGMQAQQTNVEVISNNIANMTTTGYKRRRAEFQDLIPMTGSGNDRQLPRGSADCPIFLDLSSTELDSRRQLPAHRC